MNVGLGGMDPNALQQKMAEAAGEIGKGREARIEKLPEADEAQMTRLQEAMRPPGDAAAVNAPVGPNAVVPPNTPEKIDGVVPPPTPDSLGDRILQGMSSVSEKIQAGRAEAAEVLGKENVTQAELLRANYAMIESSTTVSAVAKTTEKLTQGVKTLQQG